MVDLHVHTTHSDGSYSPEALVALASKYDVNVLGITDHDEISGINPAMQAGNHYQIKVISGVELSIEYNLPEPGHFHLIGLLFDPVNPSINKRLSWLREARRNRAFEIINKLSALGYPVSAEEIEDDLKYGSIGRPHIAALLVKKKVVSTIAEAFSKLLRNGKPAHVPKKKLSFAEAVKAVHDAGGLAIMAHPNSLGFKTYPELGEEILKLQKAGLDGIEAYYSRHDRYFTEWLIKFAEKHNLAVSGGSDFHGQAKPDILPGIGTGDMNIPVSVYENLIKFHIKKYT
ncbi:MAG: PHP domain-containing protein [Calditrichaceae bacterium]|nr:PHP domain-containing protein [Calditrichaceae bacterium]MBN2707462.1 PHP domain-containing protein [Calditrichaceae bacterium]RQV94029.1 MAG: PHP domain-containing protein [Calditrichota bacterium]